MRKSISTAYFPYLCLMALVAVVLILGVVAISLTVHPIPWYLDVTLTVMVLVAILCVAEIMMSALTYLRIRDDTVIFSKTLLTARVDFPVRDVTQVRFETPAGQPTDRFGFGKQVRLCFVIRDGSRRERIPFSAISRRKLAKVCQMLEQAGIPVRTGPEA